MRAFSDSANFNFCMAAGLPSPQPSPTGEGVGLPLPSEGGLHLNRTAKCRLPLPRAATLSAGMAAQRHAYRPNTLSAIQKAACTFRNGVQAAFLGVQRTCPLSRGRGSGFAVAAKGQPAFCGQCPNPICRLLFQLGSKSVPSPVGEG